MTKRIDIKFEVEENESIEQITKIIEVALRTANVSYVLPISAHEHKRTEFECILDDMLENPLHQNYISGCKYPKESRSYHFCVACSDKDMCKEAIVIETYRD